MSAGRPPVASVLAGLSHAHVVALTGYGEARGESLDGLVAVLQVIRNRVRDLRWPSTWSGVCLQPYQFSCWNDGDPNRVILEGLAAGIRLGHALPAALREAMYVTDGVLAEQFRDLARGACHYHAIGVRPSWATKGELVATIGRHRFYRGVP